MRKRGAFTLVELLVVIAVITVLATLLLAAFGKVRSMVAGAYCANSLRQLGAASALYLAENERTYFSYSKNVPDGRLWYFGFEPWSSGGEGNRQLDQTRGPLYPYVQQTGGVQVCPSFPYASAIWKKKFKGASWGYGFNILLSGVNALTIEQTARVVLFGDCAQVNTFQPPASPKKPMLEEFYMIDATSQTIHFRHGSRANLLFCDGHVEALKPWPGTEDKRIPGEIVGRIAPVGSADFLR